MKKILLIGYMGSGKSTIGRKLQKHLPLFEWIDLDKYIEFREQRKIRKIFQEKGEIYFRKKEHEYLSELLESPKNQIISLGGGTPCYANNHLHFKKENVLSFYLRANVPTLTKRLENRTKNRPLLKDNKNLAEFIGNHVFERSFYYNQALCTIDIDNQTKEQITEKILDFLRHKGILN